MEKEDVVDESSTLSSFLRNGLGYGYRRAEFNKRKTQLEQQAREQQGDDNDDVTQRGDGGVATSDSASQNNSKSTAAYGNAVREYLPGLRTLNAMRQRRQFSQQQQQQEHRGGDMNGTASSSFFLHNNATTPPGTAPQPQRHSLSQSQSQSRLGTAGGGRSLAASTSSRPCTTAAVAAVDALLPQFNHLYDDTRSPHNRSPPRVHNKCLTPSQARRMQEHQHQHEPVADHRQLDEGADASQHGSPTRAPSPQQRDRHRANVGGLHVPPATDELLGIVKGMSLSIRDAEEKARLKREQQRRDAIAAARRRRQQQQQQQQHIQWRGEEKFPRETFPLLHMVVSVAKDIGTPTTEYIGLCALNMEATRAPEEDEETAHEHDKKRHKRQKQQQEHEHAEQQEDKYPQAVFPLLHMVVSVAEQTGTPTTEYLGLQALDIQARQARQETEAHEEEEEELPSRIDATEDDDDGVYQDDEEDEEDEDEQELEFGDDDDEDGDEEKEQDDEQHDDVWTDDSAPQLAPDPTIDNTAALAAASAKDVRESPAELAANAKLQRVNREMEKRRKTAQRAQWMKITYGASNTGLPGKIKRSATPAGTSSTTATGANKSGTAQNNTKRKASVSPQPVMRRTVSGFMNSFEQQQQQQQHQRRHSAAALPSKHDVLEALNAAKAHFASIPLRPPLPNVVPIRRHTAMFTEDDLHAMEPSQLGLVLDAIRAIDAGAKKKAKASPSSSPSARRAQSEPSSRSTSPSKEQHDASDHSSAQHGDADEQGSETAALASHSDISGGKEANAQAAGDADSDAAASHILTEALKSCAFADCARALSHTNVRFDRCFKEAREHPALRNAQYEIRGWGITEIDGSSARQHPGTAALFGKHAASKGAVAPTDPIKWFITSPRTRPFELDVYVSTPQTPHSVYAGDDEHPATVAVRAIDFNVSEGQRHRFMKRQAARRRRIVQERLAWLNKTLNKFRDSFPAAAHLDAYRAVPLQRTEGQDDAEEETKTLFVRINCARNLHDTEVAKFVQGTSDPYVTIVAKTQEEGDDEEIYRTSTIDNCLDPNWEEKEAVAKIQLSGKEEFFVKAWNWNATLNDELGTAPLHTDVLQLFKETAKHSVTELRLPLKREVEESDDNNNGKKTTRLASGGFVVVSVARSLEALQQRSKSDFQLEEEKEAQKNVMHLTLVGARNLIDSEQFASLQGKSDPYVVVLDKDGNRLHKTAVVDDCLNPLWSARDEVLVFDRHAAPLRLRVLDGDGVSDDFLGSAELSVAHLEAIESSNTNEMTLPLLLNRGDNQLPPSASSFLLIEFGCGNVAPQRSIETATQSTSRREQRLRLHIKSAANLMDTEALSFVQGKSDPFIVVEEETQEGGEEEGNEVHRTKTIDDNLNPSWENETADLGALPNDVTQAAVANRWRVTVWNWNATSNDFLGTATVDIPETVIKRVAAAQSDEDGAVLFEPMVLQLKQKGESSSEKCGTVTLQLELQTCTYKEEKTQRVSKPLPLPISAPPQAEEQQQDAEEKTNEAETQQSEKTKPKKATVKFSEPGDQAEDQEAQGKGSVARVQIMCARNLHDSEVAKFVQGTSDPYVTIVAKMQEEEEDEEIYRTSTIDNCLDPNWEEDDVGIVKLQEDSKAAVVVKVWNWNATTDDLLGEATLSLDALATTTYAPVTLQLTRRKDAGEGDDQETLNAGSVTVLWSNTTHLNKLKQHCKAVKSAAAAPTLFDDEATPADCGEDDNDEKHQEQASGYEPPSDILFDKNSYQLATRLHDAVSFALQHIGARGANVSVRGHGVGGQIAVCLGCLLNKGKYEGGSVGDQRDEDDRALVAAEEEDAETTTKADDTVVSEEDGDAPATRSGARQRRRVTMDDGAAAQQFSVSAVHCVGAPRTFNVVTKDSQEGSQQKKEFRDLFGFDIVSYAHKFDPALECGRGAFDPLAVAFFDTSSLHSPLNALLLMSEGVVLGDNDWAAQGGDESFSQYGSFRSEPKRGRQQRTAVGTSPTQGEKEVYDEAYWDSISSPSKSPSKHQDKHRTSTSTFGSPLRGDGNAPSPLSVRRAEEQTGAGLWKPGTRMRCVSLTATAGKDAKPASIVGAAHRTVTSPYCQEYWKYHALQRYVVTISDVCCGSGGGGASASTATAASPTLANTNNTNNNAMLQSSSAGATWSANANNNNASNARCEVHELLHAFERVVAKSHSEKMHVRVPRSEPLRQHLAQQFHESNFSLVFTKCLADMFVKFACPLSKRDSVAVSQQQQQQQQQQLENEVSNGSLGVLSSGSGSPKAASPLQQPTAAAAQFYLPIDVIGTILNAMGCDTSAAQPAVYYLTAKIQHIATKLDNNNSTISMSNSSITSAGAECAPRSLFRVIGAAHTTQFAIDFATFLRWVWIEYAEDGGSQFVFRFVSAAGWKMEGGGFVCQKDATALSQLATGNLGPRPSLARGSITSNSGAGTATAKPQPQALQQHHPHVLTKGLQKAIPLFESSNGNFTAPFLSAFRNIVSHYGRTLPVSPFETKVSSYMTVHFGCALQLLTHARWSHPRTSALAFLQQAFTDIEQAHTEKPQRHLMSFDGDLTEHGVAALLRHVCVVMGEAFLMQLLWTLGYNHLLQHSVTRGTMRNVHAHGVMPCPCTAYDAVRDKRRAQDEAQFRDWVEEHVAQFQRDRRDELERINLQKMESFKRCGSVVRPLPLCAPSLQPTRSAKLLAIADVYRDEARERRVVTQSAEDRMSRTAPHNQPRMIDLGAESIATSLGGWNTTSEPRSHQHQHQHHHHGTDRFIEVDSTCTDDDNANFPQQQEAGARRRMLPPVAHSSSAPAPSSSDIQRRHSGTKKKAKKKQKKSKEPNHVPPVNRPATVAATYATNTMILNPYQRYALGL